MERLVEHARRMVEESDMTLDAKMEVLDFLILEEILKFQEYQKLEKQGLLLRLPCKVGDTVYLASKFHGKVIESKVEYIEYISNTNSDEPFTMIKGSGFSIPFCDFGKLGFLTKEEAEQKLESMQKE